MDAYLEVWRPEGRERVVLDSDRVTLGSGPDNGIVLEDRKVSGLHAVVEKFAAGWCVRDLGSRNGTFVNGERLFGDRRLRHGDEIVVGRTRLFLISPGAEPDDTEVETRPPELTRRERDVLRALCRPLLTGDLFTEPASIKAIAEELTVTEGAVKQHLLRLYDKFSVAATEGARRIRLANEAVRSGAVSVSDLRNS
ncbi:MAG TPA: FHA domain-containing protein [Actinomycetota bacterium]|nr:FHA domain-containing protein [Actinomycetota bacterium]